MSPRPFYLATELHDYVLAQSAQPDPVARSLIDATVALGGASGMQISPDQGTFMTILASVIAPTFAVEVGTFTGYSALAVARGLPEGGRLLCCDISEEWTAIGREHWERAGVADRIDLVIAPAIETLEALPSDQVIDMAFIDADKGGYIDYYEAIFARLAPRGVILVDNTLWNGEVLNPDNTEADTGHIRAFNAHVAADGRVEAVVLTVGDGLTLIRKR